MADGILIEDTKDCATIVFDDSSVTYADIRAKNYAKLDSSYADIPQKLLFAFASKNFDASYPPAGFPITYTEDENSVYVARSAILYRSAEKATIQKEDER